MILLEFIWGLVKFLFYCVARPIIWIITARDCRHCAYSFLNHQGFCYCCFGDNHPLKKACLRTPWRCKFERRKGERREGE